MQTAPLFVFFVFFTTSRGSHFGSIHLWNHFIFMMSHVTSEDQWFSLTHPNKRTQRRPYGAILIGPNIERAPPEY